MQIEVAALDPSFTHFGVANLLLDLDTLKFTVKALTTIVTEADKAGKKVVRKNSDDLSRCKSILRGYLPLVRGCRIVFAEIPVGAQSARAAFSFGTATMAVACCPVPVIQVQPTETKMASVGTKTASKEEMIEWAVENYPTAPWIREQRQGKNHGRLLNSNEHTADAIAVAHAGIVTDQFQQLLPMWRSMAA